ncbi:MAG: aminoacyl-tRNA hydrolase [Lentisphaerae bacterium GWF2_52_8]|nr:MAG: aminoacyl-tRNA hydrolase [Lentisphaerae bacterium GWF2_52_8]
MATGERNLHPRIIVGLGNPGREYAETRHNAGFMVLERLRSRLSGSFKPSAASQAQAWEGRARGETLYLLQPLTYMNLSGAALGPFARRHEIGPEEILLVYDDMDLPLGRIRMRLGGSSGGHNGVESVIAELGSGSFQRLRIGIGRDDRRNQVDHVLSVFSEDEKALFEKVLEASVEAVQIALHRGLGTAMNKFNGMDLAAPEPQDENKETTPGSGADEKN